MKCIFTVMFETLRFFTVKTPSFLLKIISFHFSSQVEHARMTQTELMRESFRHNKEMNELLQKQEELQERVMEEARAREQLALELHRAEGEVLLLCRKIF